MSGYYTKKGGQRIMLATLSDAELGVIRINLGERLIALNKEVVGVSREIVQRLNARHAEQRAARESQRKQVKIGKMITAVSSGGRKFKDA